MRFSSGTLLFAIVAWQCLLAYAAPSQSFSRTARREYRGLLRCCARNDASQPGAFKGKTCKCGPDKVGETKPTSAQSQAGDPDGRPSKDEIAVLQTPTRQFAPLSEIEKHRGKTPARKPPLPSLQIDPSPPPHLSLPRADSTKSIPPVAANAKVYHTQLSSSSLDSEPYSSRFNSGHTSPSGPLSRASSYRHGYKNGAGEIQPADVSQSLSQSLSRAPSHSHQRYRIVTTQQDGQEMPLHHYEHIWLEHAKYLIYRELPLPQ